MTTSFTRTLGRSGIDVSALGMGCWAIGGPFTFDGRPAGWSQVDDDESIRALHRAFELGVTFFDTAANYGAGHSERILGRAFADRRGDVVIATKFGHAVDEANRGVTFYDGDEANGDVAARIRDDVSASLRRLGTDYIDVYQLHVWGLSIDRSLDVRDELDALVEAGTIRTYGWSTDRADAVRAFATSPGCGVVQQGLSVLDDSNPELLRLCEELGLASVNRSPLGMGLLTGKFAPTTTFAADDQRNTAEWHPGFRDGKPTADWLDKLASIRDVLTSDGRTVTQGALGWIWARSPVTVPIPGFKTIAQVEENCGALEHGPLTTAHVDDIDRILGRQPARSPG
jgi:aryl-alcohol dehydrogenase-like predicted oxidoreductase